MLQKGMLNLILQDIFYQVNVVDIKLGYRLAMLSGRIDLQN